MSSVARAADSSARVARGATCDAAAPRTILWPAQRRLVLLTAAVLALAMAGGARAEEDARDFVEFVQDFTSTCVARQGVQILVKSRHPSRTLRVWLDRYHMGVGTGDRSRSDLAPGAAPDPLGCSRSTTGTQEWRLVRASFVD